jgi:hypothetical protein
MFMPQSAKAYLVKLDVVLVPCGSGLQLRVEVTSFRVSAVCVLAGRMTCLIMGGVLLEEKQFWSRRPICSILLWTRMRIVMWL